jgi:hypothetical protein
MWREQLVVGDHAIAALDLQLAALREQEFRPTDVDQR